PPPPAPPPPTPPPPTPPPPTPPPPTPPPPTPPPPTPPAPTPPPAPPPVPTLGVISIINDAWMSPTACTVTLSWPGTDERQRNGSPSERAAIVTEATGCEHAASVKNPAPASEPNRLTWVGLLEAIGRPRASSSCTVMGDEHAPVASCCGP